MRDGFVFKGKARFILGAEKPGRSQRGFYPPPHVGATNCGQVGVICSACATIKQGEAKMLTGVDACKTFGRVAFFTRTIFLGLVYSDMKASQITLLRLIPTFEKRKQITSTQTLFSSSGADFATNATLSQVSGI